MGYYGNQDLYLCPPNSLATPIHSEIYGIVLAWHDTGAGNSFKYIHLKDTIKNRLLHKNKIVLFLVHKIV